jgi:hypothetical protein
MPSGTLIVDPSTFTSAIVMATAPKLVFGTQTGEHDTNAAGVLKWTAQVAVSYAPDSNGMTAPAEVLNVSVAADTDPGITCPPGTSVTFDQLRVGLNPPEKRDNGTIRGGRLWYSAAGIRPAVASYRAKSDAA